jgi:hypothetical protein
MNIEDIIDIYHLICSGTKELILRKGTFILRKNSFNQIQQNGFVKVGFDTRRIDQETEINPRRGLQNYQRSEGFLSEAMGEKIKVLSKLYNTLNQLKEVYGKQPEWQDSHSRVLLSNIENGLRIYQKDGDYTDVQYGVGSLDYIQQLLHVRYRLDLAEINKMAESDLKKVILAKDEELLFKDINNTEISKRDVATQSYDSLVEKLFGGVRATAENPEVERTITITIKDKFIG